MKVWKIAQITEADCIGCSRCIPACPVDAIIGAPKHMHTVIRQECIGCAKCIAPCPVDCITLIAVLDKPFDTEKAKQRHQARKQRLQAPPLPAATSIDQQAILAAVARAKAKRQPLH